MLLLSFVNLNGETWHHKSGMRTWQMARVGDFEGHGEMAVHSWRVPSKVYYGSHFALHPGPSLIFYFRSFLLNCLTSRLCYQCTLLLCCLPHLFHDMQQSWLGWSCYTIHTACIKQHLPCCPFLLIPCYELILQSTNQGNRSTMLLRVPSVILVMSYRCSWGSQRACPQSTSNILLDVNVQNRFTMLKFDISGLARIAVQYKIASEAQQLLNFLLFKHEIWKISWHERNSLWF